jgi:hypothetical protein
MFRDMSRTPGMHTDVSVVSPTRLQGASPPSESSRFHEKQALNIEKMEHPLKCRIFAKCETALFSSLARQTIFNITVVSRTFILSTYG